VAYIASFYSYEKRHIGLSMEGLTPIQKLVELGSVNFTLQWYKNWQIS